MKYSSRFFLYAPISLFLLLAAAVCVRWWFAADALSDRLRTMNGREITPGVAFYFGERHITGFPFSLDTDFRDVTFNIATPHGPAQWHAARFAMHALTYGRDETIFEAAGPQVLHWTRDNGKGRTLTFQVGSLHASAIRDRGGLTRFDLDIVGFGSRAFTAQRLQAHLRRDRGNFDVFVTAAELRFSKPDASDLGDHIADARLAATLTDAAAFDALRGGDDKWFEAADRWRKSGGRMRIDSLSLKWNEMTIGGSGMLALDKNHAPNGAVALRIAGTKGFAARAEREHLARGPDSGLAGALLDRAGASDRLDTALGFADGVVTIGGEAADTVTPLY
jgi:hypothetical protein